MVRAETMGAWMLAGVALLVGGCPGDRIRCCEASGHGTVGHYGTCECRGLCEYGYLWGDVSCSDDPSGQACVSWSGPFAFGRNVRCFDPGGPTQEVRCCEDIGDDGVGRLAMCWCPLSGDCAWSSTRVRVEELPGGTCRVHDVPPPFMPFDAGRRDTGATFAPLECGGVPCVEDELPFSELTPPDAG